MLIRSSRTRTFSAAAASAGLLAGLGLGGLGLGGLANAVPASGEPRVDCAGIPADAPLQEVFGAASRRAGVPEPVLLAVSYMESRWDSHDGRPSTDGGYGRMHLTDVDLPDARDAKGDGSDEPDPQAAALHTIDRATDLTGLDPSRLRTDTAANICAGAALLADHQRGLGYAVGTDTAAGAWYGAVARYSGSGEHAAARRFADQVFAVISDGEARRTDSGDRVRLAANAAVRPQRGQLAELDLRHASSEEQVDCPPRLGCEWIPAPYEWYGEPDPRAYGNHDVADRPRDMDIDYIVIHNTETSYDNTIDLVTNPRYVSWQYSLRSSDGHIAQHVTPDDVAWHAGNWYVNMHSIGLEHEGWAAQNGEWFTEAMYQTSATLVRHLARRHGVPLDRAHVIGHDQVPGILPAYVRGMHWDTGPFWDWEHYFDLLGAPLDRSGGADSVVPQAAGSEVVRVVPGYEGNSQPMTGCSTDGDALTPVPCADDRANFLYLRKSPSHDAELVDDIGLHPEDGQSTTHVSDIGARAAAGHEFVVAGRQGDWTKVWYLGNEAWFHDPDGSDTVPVRGTQLVVPRAGRDSVPVYGRAYPEESSYPDEIPYQTVAPLQYSIEAGQAYVVGDARIQTDYYYAKTYDDSLPGDHTQVVGDDRYYQIWFGHRMAYVRAADVDLVSAAALR